MSRANLAELEERRVPESDGIRLMGAVDNGKACHFTPKAAAPHRDPGGLENGLKVLQIQRAFG